MKLPMTSELGRTLTIVLAGLLLLSPSIALAAQEDPEAAGNAALADEAFQSYLKQLMRRYSQEKIEHMVHSLGIELGREREAYFDDLEYAAALLDTRPDSIDGILRGDQAAAQRKLSANGSPPMREPRSVATHGNRQRVLNLLVVWGPVLLVVLLAAIVTFVRAEHP